MNDLKQKTLIDLGLNLKKKSFSIGGQGRKIIDMDSVEERIARLKNRYKDVRKMQQKLIDLINNPNTSENARDFYIADLKSLIDRKELEELEDEIRLLQEAPKLDNDFKVSAELQRLKVLNGHVQEDINRTNNLITAQMLREQQAKIKKRIKQISDFEELRTSSPAPNTYDSLNKTLRQKWAIITDFREKADDKIGELVDRNVDLEEAIADLKEKNNDDEITTKKRKENKKLIKKLEKKKSDNDTVMAENEIFLNDTEETFNDTTEHLMQHQWQRREELNLVPQPPPMLGNNYDVPNGLFGLKRDTF
jgi:hypothetical protein